MSPKIGDPVRCGVYVGHEFQPMGWGIVVADHNGYSDVHMGGGKGHWNCRPIIESYPYSHMRPCNPDGSDIAPSTCTDQEKP